MPLWHDGLHLYAYAVWLMALGSAGLFTYDIRRERQRQRDLTLQVARACDEQLGLSMQEYEDWYFDRNPDAYEQAVEQEEAHEAEAVYEWLTWHGLLG